MEKEHPLTAWRAKNHIRLEDLAEKAGCSIAHLSLIENGHRGVSLELALKLEELTKLPAKSFVRSAA